MDQTTQGLIGTNCIDLMLFQSDFHLKGLLKSLGGTEGLKQDLPVIGIQMPRGAMVLIWQIKLNLKGSREMEHELEGKRTENNLFHTVLGQGLLKFVTLMAQYLKWSTSVYQRTIRWLTLKIKLVNQASTTWG